MMVVPASTSVEERRILRELQKKLRLLDEDIERLRVAGDPESLRVSREHLVTRQKVWAAYCDLRDQINRRMDWPG
jgi:hypothetical protein